MITHGDIIDIISGYDDLIVIIIDAAKTWGSYQDEDEDGLRISLDDENVIIKTIGTDYDGCKETDTETIPISFVLSTAEERAEIVKNRDDRKRAIELATQIVRRKEQEAHERRVFEALKQKYEPRS